MAFNATEVQWHDGEEAVHKLLRVPPADNPTAPYMTARAGYMLANSPLLAIGTLDAAGRPWTALWGGEKGFARPVAQSVAGVMGPIDRCFDPVAEAITGGHGDGEVAKEEGNGRMISALGIDLESRTRVKLYGRLVVSVLSHTTEKLGNVQLAVAVQQSLPNCPKYLNKRTIAPHLAEPILASKSTKLSPDAVKLVEAADLFFISSSNHDLDMDTNHRGGPPGFVRILENSDDGCTLVYPEYSGNRLYQTLGNLSSNPKAGIVIPNFETGDVLYMTGTTEILAAENASRLLPRTNLAVKFRAAEIRHVTNGLCFRGGKGEASPYNPPVRLLSCEDASHLIVPEAGSDTLELKTKTILSPSIARYRFRINSDRKHRWKPGQYVSIGFSKELDHGYSHMNDEDPSSLNDDYVRTFTVSSGPGEETDFREFEVTLRNVGVVTGFLHSYPMRIPLEVELNGFGGEFFTEQPSGRRIAYIASGVGITPLLGQASQLDFERLSLFWTLKAADLALVTDTFEKNPGLARSTTIFVTGPTTETEAKKEEIAKLEKMGASVEHRRMTDKDVLGVASVSKWYLCTGLAMRSELLKWLEGREVLYEDFNF